jgi:hypothetical protein
VSRHCEYELFDNSSEAVVYCGYGVYLSIACVYGALGYVVTIRVAWFEVLLRIA